MTDRAIAAAEDPTYPPAPSAVPAPNQAFRAVVPPEAEAEALWARFWEGRERAARNELLLAYQGLVRHVVQRLPANVRSYWEADDLEGFGLLGLVEAIDRWETGSSPARFASYAAKRVRGAVFDELRRLDWLPRTVRRRVIAYRSTVDALSSELGRVPETSEVIAGMGAEGTTSADVRAEVRSAQLLRLQHTTASSMDGDEAELIDLLVADEAVSPESNLLAAEQTDELRRALARLPERQRAAVVLHQLGGLTQKQVGAILGVSNSRVCQMEATALATLRRTLSSSAREVARTAAVAG